MRSLFAPPPPAPFPADRLLPTGRFNGCANNTGKGGRKRKRIANRILTALGVRAGGKSRRTMSRGGGGGLEVAFSLLLDQDPKTALFAAGGAKRAKKAGGVFFSLSALSSRAHSAKVFLLLLLCGRAKKRVREANSNFLFWRGGRREGFSTVGIQAIQAVNKSTIPISNQLYKLCNTFFFSVCAKGQCLSISPKNPSSCRSFQIDCLTSPTSSSSCTGSDRRVSLKIK